MRKNKSIIKFCNSEIVTNINFLNKIPSLLSILFNCLLWSDTEPILLISKKGYKTYLIKEILKTDVNIITLNEESHIDALLGSTGFLANDELKSFYLSLFCNICIYNKKIKFLQDLKNGTLNLKTITDEIKNIFSPNNSEGREVFKGLVNRIYKKLKDLLDYQNNEAFLKKNQMRDAMLAYVLKDITIQFLQDFLFLLILLLNAQIMEKKTDSIKEYKEERD